MVLQRVQHTSDVTPMDHNEMNTQADAVFMDTDGKKVVVEAKSKKLDLSAHRICECGPSHINCLTAKDWIKCQLGVWQFNYEGRDMRDKTKHPATYPLSLARKCIELFSHQGELVVDPFMGSGTTLVAARDINRNAVGFDINPDYVALTQERLSQDSLFSETKQIPALDDARNIAHYLDEESIACIVTSPPYANLLNRERLNKSRRGLERKNEQYKKIEQYSQRPEDLGTLDLDAYRDAIAEIFGGVLPLLKKKGHCVINVPDMWWENKRITIHVAVIEALRSVGYELRNTIIWDRTNIVNNIGIFGWPSNYITMGTTFEYLLDFWRPPVTSHQTQTGIVIPDVLKDEEAANLPAEVEHIQPAKKPRKRKITPATDGNRTHLVENVLFLSAEEHSLLNKQVGDLEQSQTEVE
ncbi:MAG: DNA methyltransferase [Ktedonobacteraceae bacterium]